MIEGESESPAAVAEEIKKEIKNLTENGIDTRLFTAIKKAAYGDAVKRFDSTDSIVTDMMDCAVSGGGLFDPADILKDITKQDVIDCLKKFTEESAVLSVISPKKG